MLLFFLNPNSTELNSEPLFQVKLYTTFRGSFTRDLSLLVLDVRHLNTLKKISFQSAVVERTSEADADKVDV